MYASIYIHMLTTYSLIIHTMYYLTIFTHDYHINYVKHNICICVV